MSFKTRVQRLRRVVIPQEVCKEKGITDGDIVEVVDVKKLRVRYEEE